MTAIKKHCAFFILIAFAATLFLSDIWVYKEFVRAESYFALGARSMVERNQWLTPHAPDELQLNKPPLTYWLIGASYKLSGASYGAARLPSVLAAMGVLAIVYLLGTWRYGNRAGLISAATLASSYLFVSFARMAMSDMLLTFFVTAAFACFIAALTEETPRSRKLVFVGYVALALGVLTKGPVALALVAIPIGLELIVRRDRANFKRLRILPGLGVVLAIAAPYFFLVYARVGLGPLRFFFLGENLQRFTGQIYESGSRPFWYELAAFFSDFAPWSLLLILAAWFDWRRAERERTSRGVTRILYLWLVYTVILFSLASFKRDYYLLPAMPAAALIVGPLLANAESLPKFTRRIVAGFLVICAVVLLAIALLTLRAAVLLSVQSFLRFLPALIASVGLLLIFTWIRRRKTWQASLILAVTIWATIMSMQLILLPAFLRYQPTPQLAARIPAGRVVYTSRAADEWASGVAFNLPAPHAVERLIGDIDDQKLLDVLKSDPRAVAIIWEREYASLVKTDPALKVLADIETYGHGGLSLNLIRNPARQHLYLVGHDH